MSAEIQDLFIAGMGPVGAVATNLAGRAGLRTHVVDQSSEVFPLPRAIHFDAEIMRILQSCGLAEDVEPILRAYSGGVHLGVDGEPIREFRVPAAKGYFGWHPHYSFYQPQLEQIFRARASDYETVTRQLDAEVIDVEQFEDHVSVVVRDRDGVEQVIRARYLIACDGASSSIRKSLGIGLFDYDFNEPWIIIDATVPDAEMLEDYTIMWCDPKRPGTYVPGPGRHRRWEFMLLPGESAETMERPAAIRALLSPVVDLTGLEIIRSAVYRFHGLIAQQWRDQRVFLAGDAAHQTPPFYGQGMCHGIRDVNNLIWKLKLSLRDDSIVDLLDTYQTERLPHVRTVIDAAVENGRYICTLDPQEALERDVRLRARSAAGADVTSFRSVIPGLTAGLLSPTEHAERGQLMWQPDIEIPGEPPRKLDDLLGEEFALIALTPPAPGSNADWFSHHLKGRSFFLERDSADSDDAKSGYVTLLRDWLLSHESSAVLIRPDRYIFGLASGPDAAETLLRELRELLTPRLAPTKGDTIMTMTQPARARLSHLGFYVRDLDSQAAFYQKVFSLVETDRGVSGAGDPIVFLTGDSTEHHQLVLTAGLPPDVARTWLNQVSFRVDSLRELQAFHEWLSLLGISPTATVSHGNAWSIYFSDPEGNNVEVYASSPWYVPQPFRQIIDLTRDAEDILAETLTSVKDNGDFTPLEEWSGAVDRQLQDSLVRRGR